MKDLQFFLDEDLQYFLDDKLHFKQAIEKSLVYRAKQNLNRKAGKQLKLL